MTTAKIRASGRAAGPVPGSGPCAHRTLPLPAQILGALIDAGPRARGSRTTHSPVPPAPPPEARAS